MCSAGQGWCTCWACLRPWPLQAGPLLRVCAGCSRGKGWGGAGGCTATPGALPCRCALPSSRAPPCILEMQTLCPCRGLTCWLLACSHLVGIKVGCARSAWLCPSWSASFFPTCPACALRAQTAIAQTAIAKPVIAQTAIAQTAIDV